MRFAISLLTVLAIASVIGTVLQQNQPYSSYVIEFGQFWFDVFKLIGLFDVYHAWWFLLILVFLVISTSFCIYRQAPLMLREIKSFREHASETSLRGFAHRAEFPAPSDALAALTRYIGGQGYRLKTVSRGDNDTLIAAKAGSYSRLGYILTHAAIVIICLGGLIDGNVPLKIQEALGYKKIEKRDLPQSQVPAVSRLSTANLSFRGSISIPENGNAEVVFLNVADGYLVQELPFLITLKKFRVEHYPSGQPKSFESDLIITDPETKKSFERTIAVNHPLIHQGIAIYQASFGDGGSKLAFSGWNLFSPAAKPFPFNGVVNQSTRMTNGALSYSVELGDFRKFNIQDFSEEDQDKTKDTHGFLQNMSKTLEAGTSSTSKKNLRNVGPSYQYKLRDAQGQAYEYHSYMQPMEIEGRKYWVSGMRASPAEPFRYLRFPADENGSLDGHMRLRAMLFDKSAHAAIARSFTANALQDNANPALRAKLNDSTVKILEQFSRRGFDALGKFIEENIPEAEREKAADTYIKVLERALFETYQLSRERAGMKPAEANADTLQFVRDSLNAINDSFFFGAPVYLQLTGFEEVTATGLQITRSPGKNIVYAGSFLLTLGIFVMFYVRERRIWLLVKPDAGQILFAMSSNRKTIDFNNEFERHKRNLAELLSKG
jgi:cytochrome c biogenesis protein